MGALVCEAYLEKLPLLTAVLWSKRNYKKRN